MSENQNRFKSEPTEAWPLTEQSPHPKSSLGPNGLGLVALTLLGLGGIGYSIYGEIRANNEAHEHVADTLRTHGTLLEVDGDKSTIKNVKIPSSQLSRIQDNEQLWISANSRSAKAHEPFRFTVSQSNTQAGGPYVGPQGVSPVVPGVPLGAEEVTSHTQEFPIAHVSEDEISSGNFKVRVVSEQELKDITSRLVYQKDTETLDIVFDFGNNSPEEADIVAVLEEK